MKVKDIIYRDANLPGKAGIPGISKYFLGLPVFPDFLFFLVLFLGIAIFFGQSLSFLCACF